MAIFERCPLGRTLFTTFQFAARSMLGCIAIYFVPHEVSLSSWCRCSTWLKRRRRSGKAVLGHSWKGKKTQQVVFLPVHSDAAAVSPVDHDLCIPILHYICFPTQTNMFKIYLFHFTKQNLHEHLSSHDRLSVSSKDYCMVSSTNKRHKRVEKFLSNKNVWIIASWLSYWFQLVFLHPFSFGRKTHKIFFPCYLFHVTFFILPFSYYLFLITFFMLPFWDRLDITFEKNLWFGQVKWSEVIRWWHSLVLLCYEIWHLVSWLLNDCLSWVNTTFVMRFTFTLVCFALLWVWFALAKYGSLCFTFTRVSFTGGPTIESLLLCCTQELNRCYVIFWIESI